MGGDSERTLKCFTCGRYFAHKRSLNRHIDVEHRRGQHFACRQCGRVYNRKDNLMAHIRDRHPTEHFQNRGRSQSRGRDLARQSGSDHRRRRFSRSPSKSPLPNRREEKKGEDRNKQVVQAELEVDESPQELLQVVVSPRTRDEVEGRKSSPSRRLAGKPLAMIRQQQVNSSESEESAVAESPVGDLRGTVLDVRRVKVGRPIPPLDVKRLLRNQRVEVGEFSSQTSYNGAEQVFQETRERKYGAIFLRHSADVVREAEESGGPTKVHSVTDGVVGAPMSGEQFTRAMIGRIQSVTETTTRQTFQGGILVMKEETRKEFKVDVMAGFDAS